MKVKVVVYVYLIILFVLILLCFKLPTSQTPSVSFDNLICQTNATVRVLCQTKARVSCQTNAFSPATNSIIRVVAITL